MAWAAGRIYDQTSVRINDITDLTEASFSRCYFIAKTKNLVSFSFICEVNRKAKFTSRLGSEIRERKRSISHQRPVSGRRYLIKIYSVRSAGRYIVRKVISSECSK